ncbi:hypothetical protein QBC43DRAFT_340226 [Cladorrhinum sp. PSN259]|nr:hypothetical protein QBC43DRAFT_340226 [Cladorrhinum sp. PSN259]
MKFYLVAILFPLLAEAQLPDPQNVTVKSVGYSGNGCPQGSVSATISTDRTVITLGFDEFKLAIGPGFNPTDKVKNCAVHINLNLNYSAKPSPQFAITGATYHGYANLGTGINKVFSSTYIFDQIDTFEMRTNATISGTDSNYGQVFTETRTIPEAGQVRSLCGAQSVPFTIYTRVNLVSKFASASLNEYEQDYVPLTQQIHLKWLSC